MARINTQRPGAVRYNGMEAKFIRDVVDGPAFNDKEDQVIVEIDGVELYFYANEVDLTEDELGQAEDQAKEHKDRKARLDAAATKSNSGKEKAYAATKRGAKPAVHAVDTEPHPVAPTPHPIPPSGQTAPARGTFVPPPPSDQAQERPFAEQNMQNITPGNHPPPKKPQQPDAPNDQTPPFAPRNA